MTQAHKELNEKLCNVYNARTLAHDTYLSPADEYIARRSRDTDDEVGSERLFTESLDSMRLLEDLLSEGERGYYLRALAERASSEFWEYAQAKACAFATAEERAKALSSQFATLPKAELPAYMEPVAQLMAIAYGQNHVREVTRTQSIVTETKIPERDITRVLAQIIEIAPDLKPHFKSLITSLSYAAPELHSSFWGEATNILNEHAQEHPRLNDLVRVFNGNVPSEAPV